MSILSNAIIYILSVVLSFILGVIYVIMFIVDVYTKSKKKRKDSYYDEEEA